MNKLFTAISITFLLLASPVAAEDFALTAEVLKGRKDLGVNKIPPLPGPENRNEAVLISSANVSIFHDLLIAPVASWIKDGWFVIRSVNQTSYPWNYGFKWQRASISNLKQFGLTESKSLKALEEESQTVLGFPFGKAKELTRISSFEEFPTRVVWNLASIDSLVSDLLYGFELHWLGYQSRIKKAEGIFYRRTYPLEITQAHGPAYPMRSEVLTFYSPPVIFGFAQVLTRFLGDEEDSFWLYSPVVGRKRELLPSNRSDTVLGSNLTFDDLFVWSGKVQDFDAKLLEEKLVLVPVASLSVMEATVEKAASSAEALLFPRSATGARPASDLNFKSDSKLKDTLTVRGLENSSEGDNTFVRWNFESGKYRRAAAWVPTSAYFVPREVWIIELSPRDPYYASGRQVLVIDKESYLPVYKIIYNKEGEYERLNMGFWGIAVDRKGKKRFPIITAMLSVDAHSRQAVVWRTKYVRSILDPESSDSRELRKLLNIDEHVKMHRVEETKEKEVSTKMADAESRIKPLRPLNE